MRWFKHRPVKKPNQPCEYCSAESVGTVHGWHLCARHLAMVRAR